MSKEIILPFVETNPITESSLYSLISQELLSIEISCTTWRKWSVFFLGEFLLGNSQEIKHVGLWDHNSLPPCASVVFHHVMTVSCSSFLCALIPHLLTGNHRPSGLVHIAPSPAFPLPLKGPSPFYSSVFQGRRVWRIHPLMMKIQTVDTDLLIISHICTQDDECWMEVAFTCLFIEEVYGKCSRKWKIKRMARTKLGRFYESF